MKKLLYLLLIPFLLGAAPARVNTYTAGETIVADEVTANEDAIYNYLQAGIDTYKDDTIVNADVKSSANIQSDKLNLTSIAQNVKINTGYTFENDGTSNFDGNVDFAGVTITDLGTVTTGIITAIDLNGGVIDGVTIGQGTKVSIPQVTLATSTTHGDIFFTGSSGQVEKLAAGTSGYFLQTKGSSANPTWFQNARNELFTANGTFTAPAGVTTVYITAIGGGGAGAGGGNGSPEDGGGGASGSWTIKYKYTVTPESSYTVVVGAGGTGGSAGDTVTAGTDGADTTFDGVVVGLGGSKAAAAGNGANGSGGAAVGGYDPSVATGGGFTHLSAAGAAGGNGSGIGGGGGGSPFGAGGDGSNQPAGGGDAGANTGAGGGGGGQGRGGGDGGSGFLLVEW